MGLRVIKVGNYQELSDMAAQFVKSQVLLQPRSVLGLATGMTPLGLYQRLVEMHRQDGLSFRETVAYNLDEFLGVSPDNPVSYYNYMWTNFFGHIDIPEENAHIPPCNPADAHAAARDYEQQVVQTGVNLQVLGIGANGHIGFNEPADQLMEETHVTDLKEETIESNRKLLAQTAGGDNYHIPQRALTMGMGTILKADRILLLANGAGKKSIVGRMLTENINTHLPATFLKVHRDVTVLLDEEAAPDWL